MPLKISRKYPGVVFLISLVAFLVMLALGFQPGVGLTALLLFVSLALYCMSHPFLKSFAFTVWVFAFVAASMFFPSAFGIWFGFDLKNLIVPLIQIIMFGMGTTLSMRDFKRVLVMPWPVFVGIFLQFTVMPLVGYSIATVFHFEPEIAAGVILIGSVSGGVASNLMTFLARGDVALSVTMTSCSTLMSPVMTPFMMKILAGRLIPIPFFAMMFSILNMIIVPVVAGLAANRILYSQKRWANKPMPLTLTSTGCLLLSLITFFLQGSSLGKFATLKAGAIIGFALISVVALAKLIASAVLKGPEDWMNRALPLLSMAGICFIIAIITARARDQLMTVGLVLIAASILHNTIGYVLGYWGGKAVRLEERICRTISFEVGMQNGGMATGIAMDVLKSASAALAPAIFGPWMNISGSVLANWWRRKPLKK